MRINGLHGVMHGYAKSFEAVDLNPGDDGDSPLYQFRLSCVLQPSTLVIIRCRGSFHALISA